MPDIEITRKQTIVVDSVGENQYKDLTFKDKEGNEYKISAKRVQYFKDKITPNQAVRLNYAMSSFGKEYIYSADVVKDNLPPPQKPAPVPILETNIQNIKTSKPPDPRDANIREQVAIKELGELYRAGKLPENSLLTRTYFNWLKTALGITLETTPEAPKSTPQLVKEETGTETLTTPELYQKVADKKGWKDPKIVRSFLVNKFKIVEERIDKEPATIWAEIEGKL